MDKVVPQTPVMNGNQTAREWVLWFKSLVRESKDLPDTITVAASPFSYKALRDGMVVIHGGTISTISMTRAGWNLTLGATANPIPVRLGDVITVVYSSAPNMAFVAD